MADVGTPKTSASKRVIDELWDFAISAGYLYVCFTAVVYYKSSVLRAHGIEFSPFGFAAVKALICAKFMSIGHLLRLGGRYQNQPLIWPTLHRSFAFLLLLLALNAVEDVVVGLFHGTSFAASLSEFGGGTLDQLLATSIIGLLILIPFFALRELGNIIGGRTLFRLFFEPRNKPDRV